MIYQQLILAVALIFGLTTGIGVGLAFAGCQPITITENGQMKFCTICQNGPFTTITCN
jgi:predicted transporter